LARSGAVYARFNLAGAAAAIAGECIAVVALFILIDNAIPAI
jgi:hypothetical protein